MLLSEHVYCLAISFKMTEQEEQWICNRFCIKLEHSSPDTIQMIQKASSYGKLVIGSFITTMHLLMSHISCRGFCLNIKSPRWLGPLYSPDLAPSNFWLFPKLSHLWKWRDLRPLMRFKKIQQGSWWWRGPKVSTLKATEVSLSYVECFLYLLQ